MWFSQEKTTILYISWYYFLSKKIKSYFEDRYISFKNILLFSAQ